MREQSKLMKPYYTLPEVVLRLRDAGEDVFNVEDVTFLIDAGYLKVSLIIDHEAVMINSSFAIPFQIQREGKFQISDEDAIFYVFDLESPPNEVTKIEKVLNESLIFIPHFISERGHLEQKVDFDHKQQIMLGLEVIEKAYMEGAIIDASKSNPVICDVIPIDFNIMNIGPQNGAIQDYDFLDQPENKAFAVLIDGESYFPAKSIDGYFGEVINLELAFSNGLRYSPTFFWDQDLIPSLISNNKLVVTKDALSEYFTSIGKSTKRFRCENKQEKRENLLIELVKETGLEKLQSLARAEVWALLSNKDNALFPLRSQETLKRFFRIQNIVIFTPGRKRK